MIKDMNKFVSLQELLLLLQDITSVPLNRALNPNYLTAGARINYPERLKHAFRHENKNSRVDLNILETH